MTDRDPLTGKKKKKGFKLENHRKNVGGVITDEGDGYRAMIGHGYSGAVAYIELPKGHPDIGKGYDDLTPEVNGGLTFAEGRVFGWDYGHAYNSGTPEEHIENAKAYFKAREASE